MFDRVLKFFIENYKINYTLFLLTFVVGIYAYTQIPKEISPAIEPNSVTVRGHYTGASIETLNRIAVSEIEDEVKNIDGIDSVTSVITPGRFSVILELLKGADKTKVTEDVKDTITSIQSNLPSDMDEPTVRGVAHSRSLMHLSIMSDKLSKGELKTLAKSFKSRLLSIPDISDATIFGDSDQYYEVIINQKKLRAYGINMKDILQALSELSYIFPLGKIDGEKDQFFLSTSNGEKLTYDFDNTVLNINGTQLAVKEIATIQKRYADSSTLASMDGKNAITIAVSQNPKGDAIEIAKRIETLMERMQIENVSFDIRRDQSTIIKDRLNIVISNILLGILLITLLTYFLINFRMAMIIFLGIPTSFVLGAIYFYLSGYSININSLIGVLIAIGMIVDDAIVVSENIQQYIEKGHPPREAAYLGTREVAKPVVMASLTTLFSFIPLLMLSGRLGEIIQLIPIAFSALIIASLLETFIFLPIHASHMLSPNSRTLSWERINRLYTAVLHFLVRYQRTFLLLFFIVVPLFIVNGIKGSRFQMFQPFDSTSINITYKADPSMTLEESLQVVQTLERDILKERKRFAVRHVSSTAGYRRSATGTTEMYPYVGYISLELYRKKPSNFVDRYITPYLSLYYDPSDRIRERSSREISRDIRKWLQKKHYKKHFNLSNLNVVERRMGHVKADIRIGIISNDYQHAIRAVKEIEDALAKVKGIKYAGDNIKLGTDEIKLHINSYGERLGITEHYLGSHIANLYLERSSGVIFEKEGLLDIKVSAMDKENINDFKKLEIPLKDGSYVTLSDICDLQTIHSLERLVKDNGETNFYLFANVNPDIITAAEALDQINPLLERLKKEGIRFKFKGEREQKRVLKTDLILASALALVLIFMSMLYLFNSLRETFIVMSVIPLSLPGVFIGHSLMGLNLSLPSLIGALGLAGVIVNDSIIMMSTLRTSRATEKLYSLAARRLRPIIITSITTLVGLSSLIFFATAQSATFQPMAVSIGFGLLWGTILNLFYLPVVYHYAIGRGKTPPKGD
jgi:multidrug efflux pump subunit AcrB